MAQIHVHIPICIKKNNSGHAKIFIITPEGKQFAIVLIILTICEQCIKMFCPFRTERCLYPSLLLSDDDVRFDNTVVARVPITVPNQLCLFSLTLRCCFCFVFEVLYILYNCILLYMVYFFFFCIRHIMDGCIIFFMLDSQVAKYFSKIFKKKIHQSG